MTIPLPPIPGQQIVGDTVMNKQWYAWFNQLYQYVSQPASGGGGVANQDTTLGTVPPLLGGGKIFKGLDLSIEANGITNSLLAKMPAGTIKGNNTLVDSDPIDLTAAQVQALLNISGGGGESVSQFFTANPGQTVFTFTNATGPVSISIVSMDGSLLFPNVDYAISGVDTNTITIANPAISGQTLYVIASLGLGAVITPNSTAVGQSFLASQGQTSFVYTAALVNINIFLVTIDGAFLYPGIDYTVSGVSGNTVILSNPALQSQNVYILAIVGSIDALTQTSVGQALYPQTQAETAAGVTPVNFAYPPGAVDRYVNNLIPGTTDMGPAINTAIRVALATSGLGIGIPIQFGAAAYSVATAMTFGSPGTNILPLIFQGQGNASQIICNTTAGSGALFPLDALNGWLIRDLLLCGNSVHKNDGIHAGNVSSTEAIEWRIERVTSLMPGVGLKIQNTNTGSVESFRHWPTNSPALIVPQTVTVADVSHGIYLTGSFAHNISISNIVCLPNSNWNAAMRGIKCDASFSFGCVLLMPLVQTASGNNNETGIDWNSSGATESLSIISPYHEGTIIALAGVNQSTIVGCTDGSVLGSVILTSSTRNCVFTGGSVAVLTLDSSCTANVFLGFQARTTFTDATEGAALSGQPNRYISCGLVGASFANVPDLGGTWRKTFGPGATFNPDVYNAQWNTYRLQGATLTINAPLHPRNGQRVGFTIRNETAGAVTVTFVGFNTPPWTNPAAGQKRSIEFIYDSDFSEWDYLWNSGTDSPN